MLDLFAMELGGFIAGGIIVAGARWLRVSPLLLLIGGAGVCAVTAFGLYLIRLGAI
jgi:hypothetical protein